MKCAVKNCFGFPHGEDGIFCLRHQPEYAIQRDMGVKPEDKYRLGEILVENSFCTKN